jgi:hypothetical protein
LAQPAERLRVVEPGSLRNPSRRVLAPRQLAQHLFQAILVLLWAAAARRCLWPGRRRSRFLFLAYGRLVAETGSAGGTHHHRLVPVAAHDLEPAPLTAGAAHGAAVPSAFDLDQVLLLHSLLHSA